jgi:hypothetical protein
MWRNGNCHPLIDHHLSLIEAAQAFATGDSRRDALRILVEVRVTK